MKNKSKNATTFLKSLKGFQIITIIAYFFVIILVGLLIWSSIELTNELTLLKTNYNYKYNQLVMFQWGSIVGVSAFLIIMININIWAYWSYSNTYIPELKEKVLLRNYFRNKNKKNDLNEEIAKKQETKKDVILEQQQEHIQQPKHQQKQKNLPTDIICIDPTKLDKEDDNSCE